MRFKINSRQWERHSTKVSERIHDAPDELRDTIRVSAEKVRVDWARQWAPSRHLPYIGSTVSVDLTGTSGVYAAEIGPERGGQGSLGHLIESANGAARNRATHAGNKAARRQEGPFERKVGEVGEKGVGG